MTGFEYTQELEGYIKELEAREGGNAEYEHNEEIRRQFVHDYPIERIAGIEIDDYVFGNGRRDTFSHRMVYELRALGSINGVHASMFGIYFGKVNQEYEFGKEFGENTEEAFNKVKDEIQRLLVAGGKNDWEGIRSNLIKGVVRHKLLHVYYPTTYLCIYSLTHVKNYAHWLRIPTEKDGDWLAVQAKIMQFKNSHPLMKDWSIYKFARLLYDYYEPKFNPSKSEALNPDHGQMVEEANADFNINEVTDSPFEILSQETWSDLLKNATIFDETSRLIMARMLELGGEATTTELSEKFGETPQFYNVNCVHLSKRIVKFLNLQPNVAEGQAIKYWRLLFTGRKTAKNEVGYFKWQIRAELEAALRAVFPSSDAYTKENFLDEVFLSATDLDTIVGLLNYKKNLILQGPPGVGKSYAAKRIAYAMMGEKDESRVQSVQFHQNYSYEDFMMGYRPCSDGFTLVKGIFYNFCKKAQADPDKEYFFIIDEINRGNVSRIFGELMVIIEADHRDEDITLAYTGELFKVPKNVYLIGMMNTADRSLAMIDYALRRRFSFFAMQPSFSNDQFVGYLEQHNQAKFTKLIQQIQALNIQIGQDDSLGKGFAIGHSYFSNITEYQEERLAQIVDYEIIPLLEEYWFDDPDKTQDWALRLRGVLND